MHRLFVGLRPPAPIRAALRGIMGGVPRARWQDDDQLHLTLRFIGEIDRPLAEDVAIALGHIHAAPIEVALAGVGSFDKLGRVDALWAGVTPHDALAALHRKIDHALFAIGLAPEGRAYLPHITLARLPRSGGAAPEIARYLASHAALTSKVFTLSHFTLFESTLAPAGARYDVIERYALE